MIGQTLSHYRIVRELGKGGMGVVYLAEDTVLGREVAIKTLTASGLGNQHFRTRFLREARAVSKLSHRHIATIHDYGETPDGQPYIVMEFISGETLADLMLKGSLTIPRVLEIISEVAEALGEAHAHGIIHRDIKPSNVALNHRGEVKVLDFGLAKQIDPGFADSLNPEPQTPLNTQTREGVIVGTPMYLSPEQALGVEVDARSDLFSLGAVLYECLAGKPPFFGGSPVEICAKVIRDEPLAPSTLNIDVPNKLDRIAFKALAKKPEGRYQTAKELMADLQRVRPHVNGFNKTITRTIKVPPSTQQTGALATLSDIFKRPRLSVGYVVAAAALLGMLMLGYWYWTRARPHTPTADAQRWYDIGVNAMREGSFFQASKAFEMAIRGDDKFVLAHARQAEALMELDYVDKAKDEMLRVSELAPNRSALPAIDASYLDAITSTVRRDFPKAIEHYGEIARQLSSQPYAYVDLGRAFEKNEETGKAIEKYLAATSRDPLYAAAFLRAGTLYGRMGQSDRAMTAFDKAEEIYQAQGRSEGRAEVLFQRGVLFNKLVKIPEARTQLEQALNIARTNLNLHQQIQTLLQLSSLAVDDGEITQAQQSARDAVELARNNSLENLATSGLIELGSIYLAHGDYAGAEQSLKQALDFAQSNKGRGNEARASVMLGSLRLQQRNPEEAQHYAEQALNFYRQGGYRKETSQAFLILGRARRLKGDYEAARQVFEQQLQLAEQMSDQSLTASANGEIGAVLEQQERYPDALNHYARRYAISKSISDQKGIANSLTNRAGMFWRLGQYDKARESLAEAAAIANKPEGGFKAVSASIYQYEGEMLLSQGLFAEAVLKSAKAIEVGAQYPEVVIRAKRVMGLAKSLSGQVHAGKLLCQESLDLATKTKEPRLTYTSMLALAEATLVDGDAGSALDLALHAQENFARSGQLDSEWRAWLIAARALQKNHDEAKAQEYFLRSKNVLVDLEKKWGADFFKSYLERHDTQFYYEQLSTGLL